MGVRLSANGYDGMLRRLKEERVRLGYSQSAIGSLIGIRECDYNKSENGYRRISFAELMHLYEHGINVNYVVTGNGLKREDLIRLSGIDYDTSVGCYLTACSAVLTHRKMISGKDWETVNPMLEAGILYQAGLKDVNCWKIIKEIHGISQPAFAQELGVELKTLRNIEYGRKSPDIEILHKLYSYCRLSPAYFLRDPLGILGETELMLNHMGKRPADVALKTIFYLTGEMHEENFDPRRQSGLCPQGRGNNPRP